MTLQEQLAEAEAALHELTIGRSARVIVDQNGERVEFTATTRASLRQYIEQLKLQISGACATGPLRVRF